MAVNTNITSDVNCKVNFHCSFIYMTLLFGIMTNTTAVNEWILWFYTCPPWLYE